MRSAFSPTLLALGSILFVTTWALMVAAPYGFDSLGWIAVGALVAVLAWSARSAYEPLSLLAAGSYVGAAYVAFVFFMSLARDWDLAVIVEDYELLRNVFGCSALIALLAIVRTWTAPKRRRGLAIAWAVIIQSSFWTWMMESWFIITQSQTYWTVNRGRVALGFVLVGCMTLAVFGVGWLRRTPRPKLARCATGIATLLIVGIWMRGCQDLQTYDEEIYAQGNMPASTSFEVVPPVTDTWIPRVEITERGEVVIYREHYPPYAVREWLYLCADKMQDDDRLYLTADAAATFGAVLPFLRACLAHGRPFEELLLVVQGPRPALTWREIVADITRIHAGLIPLSLTVVAPAGLRVLHLGVDGEDLESETLTAAALRIDPQVTMERVVAGLDRLRAQGCTRIHVLVGSD